MPKKITRLVLLLGVVLVLIAAMSAGCASSDDPSPSAKATSTPTANNEARPPTVGEETLKNFPPGSPEATVVTFYYYAQWGNYPGIVRLYDPRVRKLIGSAQIAAVYSFNRDAVVVTTPRIIDARKTRDGVFVAVELTRRDAPPLYDSFLLRKEKEGWGIGYDTFFDRAYGEYARLAVDGPLRAKASEDGLLAARNASAEFRNLFLPKT